MSKICKIICAGENYNQTITAGSDDFVIACDGGLNYALKQNLKIDLVVGDFDSLGYVPAEYKIHKLNIKKNETDTFVCIQEGIAKGYDQFYIYCGTGGRVDHTLANLQLLTYLAKNGKRGYLFFKEQVITVIKDNISFSEQSTGYFSLFAVNGDCLGVNISGAEYEGENLTLTGDFPLGVSNCFTGEKCQITLTNGLLAIVFNKDTLTHVI